MNPIRTVRAWCDEVLGVLCVIEDVRSTVRSRRAVRTQNRQLDAAERTAVLRKARQGCTHTPPCPPTSAPDRTKAVEIYADDACVYLCNGLVLSSIKAPDSPSGLHTPMPEKESTP
ncbi:MAG: hypothetical protein JO362_13090 [Streptomycetaceae bacterium]|nr:hypothetical protein [Streptomycetaceae bacterium]